MASCGCAKDRGGSLLADIGPKADLLRDRVASEKSDPELFGVDPKDVIEAGPADTCRASSVVRQ